MRALPPSSHWGTRRHSPLSISRVFAGCSPSTSLGNLISFLSPDSTPIRRCPQHRFGYGASCCPVSPPSIISPWSGAWSCPRSLGSRPKRQPDLCWIKTGAMLFRGPPHRRIYGGSADWQPMSRARLWCKSGTAQGRLPCFPALHHRDGCRAWCLWCVPGAALRWFNESGRSSVNGQETEQPDRATGQ